VLKRNEGPVPRSKETALRALRNFVQSTAWVIDPYYAHPQLLPTLLHLLKARGCVAGLLTGC
jgi:hypothetical protein